MSLCDTFRRQAFWTWDSLGRARSVNATLGEESLTDFNLLEIRTRHVHEVFTKTFTKRDEAKTGADWEWWFTGRSRKWLGFRIQAKVLDLKSDQFEHLHYMSSGKYQSDLLCQRATNHSVPTIPLYCVYVQWAPNGPGPSWRCPSFSLAPELFGCSLVDAHQIGKLRPNKRKLQDLFPHMIPWHCLVCCKGYGSGDLPERAFLFWREQWTGESTRASIELVEEPPPYVLRVRRSEAVEVPDKYLRAVTVFDENPE